MALVTGLTALPALVGAGAGVLAALAAGVWLAAGVEPVSVESTEETPGGWSLVAACACFESRNSRKNIPAAASTNCAPRRATRYAIGCDIDSSRHRETHVGHPRPKRGAATQILIG
jgi:hypothetical protein